MTVTLDRNVENFIGAPRQLFINGQWADAASAHCPLMNSCRGAPMKFSTFRSRVTVMNALLSWLGGGRPRISVSQHVTARVYVVDL